MSEERHGAVQMKVGKRTGKTKASAESARKAQNKIFTKSGDLRGFITAAVKKICNE